MPESTPNVPRAPRKPSRVYLVAYLIGLAILLLLPYVAQRSPTAQTVPFSDFRAAVDADQLSQVEITPESLIGTRKAQPGKQNQPPQLITATRLPGIDETSLVKELEAHHVRVIGKMQSSHPFLSFLIAWLPFLLLMGFMMYGIWRGRQAMGGPLQFGKNRAKIYDHGRTSAEAGAGAVIGRAMH